MTHDDRDLLEIFARQRDADLRAAPSFAQVTAGRPARPVRVYRAVPRLVLAATVLLVVVGVWRVRANGYAIAAIPVGELRVPSDILLDMLPSVMPMGAGEYFSEALGPAPSDLIFRRKES